MYVVEGEGEVMVTAVGTRTRLAGIRPPRWPVRRSTSNPELGRDHHPVANGLEGFAEDAFGLQRPAHLRPVEQGDALVNGRADDGDHVLAAADRFPRHRLTARPTLETSSDFSPRRLVSVVAVAAAAPPTRRPAWKGGRSNPLPFKESQGLGRQSSPVRPLAQ